MQEFTLDTIKNRLKKEDIEKMRRLITITMRVKTIKDLIKAYDPEPGSYEDLIGSMFQSFNKEEKDDETETIQKSTYASMLAEWLKELKDEEDRLNKEVCTAINDALVYLFVNDVQSSIIKLYSTKLPESIVEDFCEKNLGIAKGDTSVQKTICMQCIEHFVRTFDVDPKTGTPIKKEEAE